MSTYIATNDGGGRHSGGTEVAKKYNPVTKKWESVYSDGSGASSSSSTKESVAPPVTVSTPANPYDSDPVNSKSDADKDYIEMELNTLEGDMVVVQNSSTIRIKAGQTVQVYGVGKFLSGLYFVSKVSRKIDKSNGYSQTLTLIRTGFGETLKQYVEAPKPTPRPAPAPAKPKSNAVGGPLKYKDKVKIVGANAFYTNADYGVPVPNWVKQRTHTVDAISEDGQRVRLKEIWSWTFIKFTQKV